MFICSVHGNTIKFFGIIGAAVLSLVLLIVLIPENVESREAGGYVLENEPKTEYEAVETVNFEKVKTNEQRIALLKSYGWEVEETPVEEIEITIPAEFDRVMESYNAIQKSQGFDLTKYRNRDMKRFTYRVTNYPDYNGTVFCNILVYKNRVVGGDICSSDVNGFIKGFTGDKLN